MIIMYKSYIRCRLRADTTFIPTVWLLLYRVFNMHQLGIPFSVIAGITVNTLEKNSNIK